jgi:hypothetical protein
MSTRVITCIWTATVGEEFEAFDTEILLAPAAALVTACGIGQRSRTLEKNSYV